MPLTTTAFRVGQPRYRVMLPSYPPRLRSLRGLGATDQQITALFGTIGSAIPVAGPFIQAAAGIAISIESMFQGCGQTCVQASNIANQVGDLLQQNLDNYLALPIHYASLQAAALKVFDGAWAQLVQACNNPALAAAGQRCISDRQRGACTWKNKAGGWVQDSSGKWSYVPPGAKDSGSDCWNWFIGLRDPIANDPTVVPDPAGLVVNSDGSVTISNPNSSPTSTTTVAAPTSTGIPMPLLLGGAALILLLALGGTSK